MKKQLNLYSTLIISLFFAGCIGETNNNNNNQPNPPNPQDLPNVFDANSVQNIKFETLKLDDSYLKNIDLTKVAGHATYKIRITNPNNFIANITNINFNNERSTGNYYFSKNSEADNCFNKSWYKQNSSGASLAMPAKDSCSLYTTSLWLGIQQQSGTDTIDYELTNAGFGFQVKAGRKINLWCNNGCSPIGRKDFSPTITNNTISFTTSILTPTSDPTINNIPLNGFALGGDYLFSVGTASLSKLSFTRYQINYNKDKGNLDILGGKDFSSQTGAAVVPSYSGFAISKDGYYATYTYNRPNFYSSTTLVQNIDTGRTYGTITNEEPTIGLQGLDNNLLWNSASYHLFFQTDFITHTLAGLNKLSPTLPYDNSTILGVDADGNMVIKTGSSINCHMKQTNYVPVSSLSSFTALGDSLVSSKYLYTNHANSVNKYYNFNGNVLLANNLYYQVDTSLCQVISLAENTATPFLAIPTNYTLIITDKYTAIKTNAGYSFASIQSTSDGNNNLD
ncbi:MAG TPA: hypothetical protein PKD00_10745 [Burkholderiales bacterium]|nr:hypothetical protein [Burkholderiales bacterium]